MTQVVNRTEYTKWGDEKRYIRTKEHKTDGRRGIGYRMSNVGYRIWDMRQVADVGIRSRGYQAKGIQEDVKGRANHSIAFHGVSKKHRKGESESVCTGLARKKK